jgi:hypothetical protein
MDAHAANTNADKTRVAVARLVNGYLAAPTDTPMPPGMATGDSVTREFRTWIVTVRPQAIPTAAPNTTSLAQC